MDRCSVYRLYDEAGALLYVGCTYYPGPRLAAHRSSQPWADQIARQDVVWYDTRDEALRAEAEGIRTENPRWNSVRMRGNTPLHSFRLKDDLKARVQARAKARGETMTDVVLRILREYADGAA